MSEQYEFFVEPAWSDMDALGHVNNAAHFRYFESARLDWLLGQGYQMGEQESGPVILESRCAYRAPIVWPCPLRIVVTLERVGNSSYSLAETMTGRDDGVLYAEASFTCVWVDRATGRSMSIPDSVRENFNKQ